MSVVFLMMGLVSLDAFQPSLFRMNNVRRKIDTFLKASTIVPSVSTVSVCTAELCKCQEEWQGADYILDALLSRNLPFPVDEAPCLGACGGGAMVAIDFEDGSSALVSGLDETLKELGLVQDEGFIVTKQESDREILTSNVAAADKKSTALVVGLERDDENEIVSIEVLENFAPENYPQTPIEKKLDHGAVDRMRAETTNNNILVNPWLDAASYLAKKAGEKIFRKGD